MIEECLMVEFRIEGDDCPLADASSATGTPIEAAPPLLRDDRNVLLRFSAQASEELGDYLDGDDRIRYLYQSVTEVGTTTGVCRSSSVSSTNSSARASWWNR